MLPQTISLPRLPPNIQAQACRFNKQSDFQLALPKTLRSAVAKRKADFWGGRWCVQQLYQRLEITAPLPEYQAQKPPHWPANWQGSISHTWTEQQGLAIAVMSNSHAYLGVDLEALIPIEKCHSLRKAILHSDEDWIQSVEEFTLAFSFKESIYKGLNRVLQRFIGFDEVAITQIANNKIQFEPRNQLRSDLPEDAPRQGYYYALPEYPHIRLCLYGAY